MTLAHTSIRRRADRLAAMAGVLAIAALVIVMSGWTGQDNASEPLVALMTFTNALPLPLCWLAAALGVGWPMQRWLAPVARHPLALQAGLGIAGLLILDSTLGAVGLLTNQGVAWLAIAIGLALLACQIAARLKTNGLAVPLPHWVFWSCAPALAVLLLAACSAPGWLWSSEFGGYDALSYHLQLPKEWLARGRIVPLDHNVYSFLPGYMESAYLHIMTLRGNSMNALIDCQMLHALLTILAAAFTGLAAARVCSPSKSPDIAPTAQLCGTMAAALYLITPWTIVVGSLAYNETAVNLLLAAGLLAAMDDTIAPGRRGALIGALMAAACGAKLTAVGFVVAPLGLALLALVPRRAWPVALAGAAIAAVIGLLPYVLRNAMNAGNPVFPFATGLLGLGHWTAEQAIVWQTGHSPDVPMLDRLRAVWQQFIVYGWGANPLPREPWKPQWGALPWLGALGGIVAIVRSSPERRYAVLLTLVTLMQIAFWLTCTHLKSRFLLPAAVPMCMLAALGAQVLLLSAARPAIARPVPAVIAVVVLTLSLLPVSIYRNEGNGAPALAIGTASQQSGDALLPSQRQVLGSSIFPAVAINWLLPEGSRVLLVGEAAPLYMRLDRIDYNTVWDRGPLSNVMREKPDDPEAWRAALRKWKGCGFTHVLVNYTMLDVWQRSGWNDPLITRRSVTDFAETTCEPLYDYPNDITLYRLPD